jgi:hypothetical protein
MSQSTATAPTSRSTRSTATADPATSSDTTLSSIKLSFEPKLTGQESFFQWKFMLKIIYSTCIKSLGLNQ